MSEFKFCCPNCDQHIGCDESYYGVQIACPSCNTPITVPTGFASASLSRDAWSPEFSMPVPGGLGIANQEPAANSATLRLQLDRTPGPASSLADAVESESKSGFQSPDGSAAWDMETGTTIGIFGMYEQLESTAKQVRALPQFNQPRPGRLTGFKAFFLRAGRAIRLIFTEKELITFSLLQWSVIGIAYYLWVQVLGWIPEEAWTAARHSDSVSVADVVVVVWSLLCIGLAAFPLGILSGCMGTVHFLNRQGHESTIARCFKIVMPHSFRLWIFTWIDGAITCRQILERLPKKDEKRTLSQKAVSEALYYAWKLGTAGVLPGLILGKGLFKAGQDSVLLVKNRFLDMALLRGGYSALCWIVGILAYVGGVVFFLLTNFFGKTQGLAQGIQLHQFYQLAGVPILIAVGVVLVFLRPLFLISLCDIYAEELEERGEVMELAEAPSGGKAAMVAFGVLAVIVTTGGLYLQPLLKSRNAATSVSATNVGQSETTDSESKNANMQSAADPVVSKALRFNSTDDWLQLSPIDWQALSAFTFEVWVRDWNGVIGGQGKAGDPENSIWLALGEANDKNQYPTSGWESNARNKEFRVGPAPTNRWVHFAMEFDGRTQSFYLDGQLKHRVAAPRPGPFDLRRSLAFGKGGKGSLRSVRISSTARYDGTFRPTERWTTDNQTLLLLEVGNRAGNILRDSSGHGNDALIHGDPVYLAVTQ